GIEGRERDDGGAEGDRGGAVVDRRRRRQEEGASELHLASVEPNPLPVHPSSGDRVAATRPQPRLSPGTDPQADVRSGGLLGRELANDAGGGLAAPRSELIHRKADQTTRGRPKGDQPNVADGQSHASSLPNPWIAPATLPRRSELQIIALSQVTTVVSRSFSKLSKVEKLRG